VPGGTPVRKSRPEPELPSEVCGILSVTPAGEGDTVAVTLSLPALTAEGLGVKPQEGKDGQTKDGRVKVRLYLLVEQYAELGVRVGEATPETVRSIVEAGRLCAAIRRGMLLLEYGDQSARRLVSKLTAKGVDRETASRAAAYLTDRGYIREEDTATLRARQSVRKGWGPRRIREDLRAQGFTEEAADEAMEALDGEDWVENCAAVLSKKYGEIPDDRGERQKMIAALMRLGYDADTVREAMRMTARATARKK
jgi:SOS response regulatory protein OraA/RecX